MTEQLDSDVRPAGHARPDPVGPRRPGGLVVGVVVAIVVLMVAGVVTWIVVSRSGSSEQGSNSPQQAATRLLADIGSTGLTGAVNDLPPTEAAVLRTIPSGGLSCHTSGITFDSSAIEQVNDHIAVTKLVGGTITVSASSSANSTMIDILRAAFPDWDAAAGGHSTVDVGQLVRRLGHPLRIVTVDVGGRWYPSVYYTIADNRLQALHEKWPTQAVPSVGADVPNEAVEDFIQAVVDPNIRLAVEHTSSDGTAVLHDAGLALVDPSDAGQPSGITVGPITFDDVSVTGGVDVVLRTMTLTAHGQRTVVTRDGACFTVRTGSARNQLCAADVANRSRTGAVTNVLPSALVTLLDGMLTGSVHNSDGIFATESKEVWYVDLGRTFAQFSRNSSGAVTPQDLAAALGMG